MIFVTLRESPHVFQRGLTPPRTVHDSAHTCTCKYGHKHTILRPTIANVAFAFNTRDLCGLHLSYCQKADFCFWNSSKKPDFWSILGRRSQINLDWWATVMMSTMAYSYTTTFMLAMTWHTYLVSFGQKSRPRSQFPPILIEMCYNTCIGSYYIAIKR